MKSHLLLLPTILFFSACSELTNEQTEESPVESVVAQSTINEYCYYRTEGNNNEDSNVIKLIIKGNKVTGEMKYLPYEKDASIGTVAGTKEGNIIKLKWTYYQEGMEATEPVSLKLDIDGIWQQQTSYNENGEIIISTDAPYEYKYLQLDCAKFPERNY